MNAEAFRTPILIASGTLVEVVVVGLVETGAGVVSFCSVQALVVNEY